MNGNIFVKLMLKSPLQIFMGNTMLITVTGRKTGNKYTTPVGYYQDGNTLWIISNRDRTWWRNVRHCAEVDLHLHGKETKGVAEAVLDEPAVTERIMEYVQHIPMSAKSLGVGIENGMPNCDDAARLAKEKLFVKIQLKECIDGIK